MAHRLLFCVDASLIEPLMPLVARTRTRFLVFIDRKNKFSIQPPGVLIDVEHSRGGLIGEGAYKRVG